MSRGWQVQAVADYDRVLAAYDCRVPERLDLLTAVLKRRYPNCIIRVVPL